MQSVLLGISTVNHVVKRCRGNIQRMSDTRQRTAVVPTLIAVFHITIRAYIYPCLVCDILLSEAQFYAPSPYGGFAFSCHFIHIKAGLNEAGIQSGLMIRVI